MGATVKTFRIPVRQVELALSIVAVLIFVACSSGGGATAGRTTTGAGGVLNSPLHPAGSGPASTSGPVLVTPLCGHPAFQQGLLPPFKRPGNCPLTTPAGTYASALLGVHVVWPFIFKLPDGWQVAAIPDGNGLDLRAHGTDVGVSIIVYPQAPKDRGVLESPRALANWVGSRSFVFATPVTPVDIAGERGWQVDVRPHDGAANVAGCRVGTQCVPLLRPMWGPDGADENGPATVVALLPHITSRLIFFDGGLLSVVWIWDNDDRPGSPATRADVQQVVDSLHFQNITCC
jgi:hypothetical protein